MKKKLCIILLMFFTFCVVGCENGMKTGSVIFIHPDGSGAAMWTALRLMETGPDGYTNWDQMERMGIYREHLKNSTNASSHGGATVHAFGVKVDYDTYGNNPKKPFKSLSGKDYSIMIEAKRAGKSIALINSGHICEPGTGVFVASAAKRAMTDTISDQIIHSGADIILSGGEELLLPEGMMGRHGRHGLREDGRNLIKEAEDLGYKIVYTRNELIKLPANTDRVLGVFSSGHTFNDQSEESLKENDLPLYNEHAPTIAEMTEKALEILEYKGRDFLLVVEEEGSDNFSNKMNAQGALEALRRADEAIGNVMNYIKEHPHTLLLTAADSNAGGLHIVAVRDPVNFDKPLPDRIPTGAPLDGRDGTATLPFVAAPDAFGNQLRFGISWISDDDLAGGIIAKAHGLNSDLIKNNVDNTDIYRMMYATLFGVEIAAQ